MLKKHRNNKLTITALLLALIGITLYFYPDITNIQRGQITEQEIVKFDQAVQYMRQEPSKSAGIEEEAKSDQQELTPLDQLLQRVQSYNQSIYEEGQNGLVDAFSYEQSSIDLSQYGIEDNMFGFIEIPKIKIKLGIFLGATTDNMSKGAVHLSQTSLPIGGTNTNAVIAAHRGTSKHGDMFRNIDKIEIGDKVYITNAWGALTYQAATIAIIQPDEIDKILIQQNKDMVTLISCNPYGKNIQRYVVYCERMDDNETDDK